MRKIDKEIADSYFKKKVKVIVACLAVWFCVSYVVVMFAEYFMQFSFNKVPFHYYMGSQGAQVTFILLLLVNALILDKIDKDHGIDETQNRKIGAGKAVDH